MTLCAIQAVLWMDSGLAEDYATNTYHIETDDVDPLVGATDFFGNLVTYYRTFDEYLSAELQGTMAYRAYNLEEPEPRVPFYINGDSLIPGATRWPSEVSLCTSFAGLPISGQVQARRRGRAYIGPLAAAAGDTATGRPAAAFITALAAATDTLATVSLASLEYSWIVYSPTYGLKTTVQYGWVDNAFDTQRRRGLRATSRTTWTA